jgi:hypothetical protein
MSVLMVAVNFKASKEVVQLLLEKKADITAVDQVIIQFSPTCLQADAKCLMGLFCCVTTAFTCLLRELSHHHALLCADWKDCVDARCEDGWGCEHRDPAAPPGQRRRGQYQRQK